MSKSQQISYVRIPFLVFLILLSGLLIIGYNFRLSDLKEIRSLTLITDTQIALRVQELINSHLDILHHVRDDFEIHGEMDEESFNKHVYDILEHRTGFQAINFINPEGVIQWINPVEGNEMVLGRDLHSHQFASETFSQAEQTVSDQITPPIRLWQGGIGFATYFPVRKNGELVGFVNGVVRLSNFLDNYLLLNSFNQFHIIVLHENEVIYEANAPASKPRYDISTEQIIHIGKHDVSIQLIPHTTLFSFQTDWLRIIFYLVGFLFSVAFSIITYLNLKRQYNLEITTKQIQSSEEKYRGIFENSNDAIYQSATDGSLLMANDAWHDLFGYQKEELKSFNVTNLYYNQEDRSTFVKAISENGFVKNYDMVLKNKAGNKVYCILSSTIMVDEAGEPIGYQGIIHDITEKIEREKILSQALDEAEKSARLKNNIIKNMSHEIRTPLNTILGFSEILKDEMGRTLSTEQEHHFSIIRQSGKRLIRTISEILDYSVLESGNYTAELKPTDVVPVLHSIIDDLANADHTIQTQIHTGWESEEYLATIDEYSFNHAMANIIHNAIQFSGGNHVSIEIQKTDSQIIIVVKDQGIGISADFQDDMFDVFSQESAGLGRHYEGLGLGLPLAKLFIELNRGTIHIDSKKNKGTTVTVSLPSPESP